MPRTNALFVFQLLIGICLAASHASAQNYPRVTGYASIVHPLVSVDVNGSSYNFSGTYTVGFPMGLNLLKSDHIGFSFELTPFIKAENGTDKVSNVLFHPGVLFRFPKGFTFISRLAFETAGRYGFTPVFSKVLIRSKNLSYFAAIPLPVRFGNDKPPSAGIAIQLGITF